MIVHRDKHFHIGIQSNMNSLDSLVEYPLNLSSSLELVVSIPASRPKVVVYHRCSILPRAHASRSRQSLTRYNHQLWYIVP